MVMAGGNTLGIQAGQTVRLALTEDQVALVRAKAETLKGVTVLYDTPQGPVTVPASA